MLNIKQNPHGLLLFAAIALVFMLTLPPIGSMDFQGVTMFGVPFTTMAWMIPFSLVSLWLLYLVTKRFLYSMTITWINVLATLAATILIVPLVYIGMNPSHDASVMHEFIGNTMQMLFVMFVCGQFAYLANVLLGVFRRR